MLFNSYAFLFAFLPAVLVGFHLLHRWSRRLALAWITASSLIFYGYWDYRYLALIVPSICINCALGYLIARHWSKTWLIAGVAANLAVIAWFKYSLFVFVTMTGGAAPPEFLKGIILPLGISFFTFQQIAYLVNVWRGHEAPARLEVHAFIVLFFPHLIAGPIVLYENIVSQVKRRPRIAGYLAASFKVGLFIFALGLFKKVVIADSLASYVNEIFTFAAKPDYDLLLPDALIGATGYSLQLYFDFSGYSDMAIGLGRMFGFRLPMNFNSPYQSVSMIDFWRRWHMTLSSFFRNYVYIPLGGNKKGLAAQMLFVMIVFFLTGLWHGAGWTFIVWGLAHGVLVVINHLWANTALAQMLSTSQAPKIQTLYKFISWGMTMTAVAALWVIFRADSWGTAKKFFDALLTFQLYGGRAIPDLYKYYILPPAIVLLFICCWLLPNSLKISRWVRMQSLVSAPQHFYKNTITRVSLKNLTYPALTGGCLYLAITSISYIKSQFLYFNF
jgi:alginate O-acetyltransferase complex protein AlgI